MSRPVLEVVRLGLVPFAEAMQVQRSRVDQLKTRPGSAWTLLLCEHQPVYTVGLRSSLYSDQDLDQLRTTGAQVHRTDRGGLITFHGPGQLVCYPIMHLGRLNKGIRLFVSSLELSVLDVCRHFGLKAETSPHTGVWVGDNKICAMGVHCSRRVTSHGLALNCDVDLSWFQNIVPCGLRDRGVTSLSQETQRTITVGDSVQPLVQAIGRQFNCDVIDQSRN
ncbi:unnamed protein product [Knipowitschia caucasica]